MQIVTVCKYDAYKFEEETENPLPIAGWVMYVANTFAESPSEGEEVIMVETGVNGCVDVEVDANNGPWYVTEEAVEGWRLLDIVVEGGAMVDNEDFMHCEFFADEIILSKFALSEADNICEFYNADYREEVTGYKWNDENSDGVKDSSEDGVSGWAITATDESEAQYSPVSTETDANGFYSMMLPSDGYWIITEESRSDWTQTAVYENGYKLTDETEEGGPTTECSLYLGSKYSKVSIGRKKRES